MNDYRKISILMLNCSTTDEASHSAPDSQRMRFRGPLSEPGVSDFADGPGMFLFFDLKTTSTCSCFIDVFKLIIKNGLPT